MIFIKIAFIIRFEVIDTFGLILIEVEITSYTKKLAKLLLIKSAIKSPIIHSYIVSTNF